MWLRMHEHRTIAPGSKHRKVDLHMQKCTAADCQRKRLGSAWKEKGKIQSCLVLQRGFWSLIKGSTPKRKHNTPPIREDDNMVLLYNDMFQVTQRSCCCTLERIQLPCSTAWHRQMWEWWAKQREISYIFNCLTEVCTVNTTVELSWISIDKTAQN